MTASSSTLAARVNARRLINGPVEGEFNPFILHPIKYAFAMDAYKTGNGNHWLPEVIPMQRDIEQWQSPTGLTDDERRVVKVALGYFTTADSIVANNLVLAVYRHITAPECRMYLLRQAYEEAIHTNSYQYIVESLGLDEEEIFSMYRDARAIHDKDQMTATHTPALLDPAFKTGTPEADQQFLRELVDFYIVTEGVFFYSSFAAMLSFRQRNLLPGTAEQFQYIMRDESMHMNFGIDLVNGIRTEQPDLWTPDFVREVTDRVAEAAVLEEQYALFMMPRGILGLNAESFGDYTKYVADRRLASIGIAPHFGVQNPYPWMAEAIDIPKSKNFFETRVTEYRSGALQFDDF